MNFETSKTLGGIGAILLFLGVFPIINYYGVIDLVGAILVLIGLYGLANYYNDRTIFNNALFGILAAVIGVVIAGVVAFVTVMSSLYDFLYQLYPGWDGNLASIQNMTPNTNIDPMALIPFLTGLLLILVIVWVFAIIAAFFIRRSLREVAVRSGTGLFATSGLLLLIGAVLVILFGLGLILVWLAALLLAIAFFTMKKNEPAPPPPVTMAPPAPPAPTSV